MPLRDPLPDSDPCWGLAPQWVDSKHMHPVADGAWAAVPSPRHGRAPRRLRPERRTSSGIKPTLPRLKMWSSATTNYACADHYLTQRRLPYRPLQPGRPARRPPAQTDKGYSGSASWTGSRRRPLLLADVGPSRWGKRHGSRRWNTPPVQEPPSSPPGNRSACPYVKATWWRGETRPGRGQARQRGVFLFDYFDPLD